MKKVLSLFLVFLILTGITAFAAEIIKNEEGVVVQKTELAQLYDMGIMEDIGEGPFQNITRAEMAQIVVQALNMKEIEMESTFIDVTSDNKYSNQIGVVQSMNIMCGYGNGIFKPDEYITYYEVVKTIVTMLGYEPLALQRGGYPEGYLKVGNELGIILYPGAKDFVIDKNDIGKILLRATDVPLMLQSSFGENVEYQISEETLKNKFLK